MFPDLNLKMSDIGRQNVLQSKTTLDVLGIAVLAEEVGGDKGRSAYYSLDDGAVRVRTAFTPDSFI